MWVAVDLAERGEIVYLVRGGRQVAAIMPPGVAAAAIEALDEAEDLRVALAVLAEDEPTVPLGDILAKYADDLAVYPDDDAR
jgi:hypothetical protein